MTTILKNTGRLGPRRIDPGIMFFIDREKSDSLKIEQIVKKIKIYANSKINRAFSMVDFSEFNDDSGVLLIIIGLIPNKNHLEEFGVLRVEK